MSDCSTLRLLLAQVGPSPSENALLLSGGLDSTILASVLKPEYAVTVILRDDAPDLSFAKKAADRFCRRHRVCKVDFDLLPELVDELVETLKTFDPIEIRNSIVALLGLREAKRDGYSSVATGDGADELFAGYNYLSRYHSDPDALQAELLRLWGLMHFSSLKLGEREKVRVVTPYLSAGFSEFAKSLDVRKKIGLHENAVWGKFILRKCFEGELGSELAWRKKMAQEEGAGSDSIAMFVDSIMDASMFVESVEAAKQQGVRLRSKEHAYYYQSYLRHFSPPREESETECKSRCPECLACFKTAGKFCRTCGAYPVVPV